MPQNRALAADPVLRVLVGAGVLLVPWFLFVPGGTITTWVLQTAIDVATICLAVRLVRLGGRARHVRRFWISVAAAMVFSAAADGYQSFLEITGRAAGTVSVAQTGLVDVGMLLVVVTMLFHPLGGVGRQRLRMSLDGATVLTAVAVFLWYFLLAGKLSDGGMAERLAAASTAAVMLLVTFGLIKLIYSSSPPFRRGPAVVGTLGVTGTAVAAPLAQLVIGQSGSAVLLIAQLMPCVLIPVSLRLQELLDRRAALQPVAAGQHTFSRLPYAAVAGTQILLFAGLAAVHPGMRIWGVATGVLLITGLVLIRQQAAFVDNERLVAEVSASREWFSALLQQASDLIVVIGADDVIQYASPAATRVLGAERGRAADVVLRRVHPGDRPAFDDLSGRLTPGTPVETELRLTREDGTYRWLHVVATDLRGNPNIRGVVWNSRDITDARLAQDELRHQATHDSLTGLANRLLLQQRVGEADPAGPISMLLIDLDGFKQINDGHGHHAGDEVLVTVAHRITALTGSDGTVARLGGDEFAVLLPGAGPARAQELATRIAAAAAEPIAVAGALVTVGASVGVAAGTPADAERLLRDADEAMYRTKQSRRAAA